MPPVTGGNGPVKQCVSRVTKIAGYGTNAFQTPVPKHKTEYKNIDKPRKIYEKKIWHK